LTPVTAWGGAEEFDVPGFVAGDTLRVVIKSADGIALATTLIEGVNVGELCSHASA